VASDEKEDDLEDSSEVEAYLAKLAERLEAEKGDYPEPPNRDSLLKIFREIKDEKDVFAAIKLGFIKEEELGKPKVTDRDYFNIARYADSEGLDTVAGFLRDKAVVTTATSLALKAKLLELPFTVKRYSQSTGGAKRVVKRGLFGETAVEEGHGE